jgi:hypothetical protein
MSKPLCISHISSHSHIYILIRLYICHLDFQLKLLF